jgi:hypothetical protein
MEKSENNIIRAKEGKTFRRISDGFIAGDALCLGKTYYLAGKLLDEPLDELPEHYEEVEKAIIDEAHPLIAPLNETVAEIPVVVETPVTINEEEITPENGETETIVLQETRTVTITAWDIVSMQEKIDKIIGVLTPAQKKKLGLI